MTLANHGYGKSGVRLVKVVRHRDRHELKDFTVAVRLEGEFDAAYVGGDNRDVLPTDTMKNTIYALASRHEFDEVEQFGLILAEHFLGAAPAASRATVSIEEHAWRRLSVREKPHRHAFLQPGGERRLARVWRSHDEVRLEAGIDELTVLKTAGSSFSGFLRDRYTTLADTGDRILASTIKANWLYTEPELPYGACWRGIRQTLLETFADHESRSVQHTLHAMADAVLAGHEEIEEITISMPNLHHLPVDLAPFGLSNRNEVFLPTAEPFGLIEATERRGT
jgi:urate oxidase